jgi:hypothetical protein
MDENEACPKNGHVHWTLSKSKALNTKGMAKARHPSGVGMAYANLSTAA